jgi:leader peptidase (prepilin peptidase) / N-methyltransferase
VGRLAACPTMECMVIAYWLVTVFIFGAVVGSFLNVCIARLPLEKSILWPGSRCGSCFEPIHWYDNLPIISYLWLRGHCRHCGARFSARYFIVELVTALTFTGLFYGEVVCNIHDWPVIGGAQWAIQRGFFPWQWWVVWFFHACLVALLLAASVCDLDGREIPLPLTLTGTFVGLVGSILLAWPWPRDAADAVPQPNPRLLPGREWQVPLDKDLHPHGLREGAYPWPVWGPLPAGLVPGDWKLGLATGLAGLLVGTFMMRGVAFLFSRGLGREALGLGDADLMMMAGAFLGWQPVVVAFFLSVIPALLVGAFQLIIKRDNELPFGPSLAIGIVMTFMCWRWIGPPLQPLFFFGDMVIGLVIAGAAFMLLSSYVIRVSRGAPSQAT